MRQDVRTLAERLDALLPQTQCRRCGHDGCRPYAEAIARGEAINRCAPGGDAAIAAIAETTGLPRIALDPVFGRHEPLALARVDEAACIGCTLCIAACPVDAIVGAQKRMHAVIASLCTGCALCVPPCPVDCIAMVPAGRAWSDADARAARERFKARNARNARCEAAAQSERDAARRRETVARAIERARARRGVRTAA